MRWHWAAGLPAQIWLALFLGLVTTLVFDVQSAQAQTKEMHALTAQFTKLYDQGRFSGSGTNCQRILAKPGAEALSG